MKFFLEDIKSICNHIYSQIGSCHSESIYQTILHIELVKYGKSIGASDISVELEKNIPIFYTDTNGVEHMIGTERIDLFVRYDQYNILIELKATNSPIKTNEILQLQKYVDSLTKLKYTLTHSILINFSKCTEQGVLFHFIN